MELGLGLVARRDCNAENRHQRAEGRTLPFQNHRSLAFLRKRFGPLAELIGPRLGELLAMPIVSVSSTTSSFVLRRRAHNVDTWFFLLAPRLYRRLHRARNVSGAEFGQLDRLAGMRWDPTRFLLPKDLLVRKNAS